MIVTGSITSPVDWGGLDSTSSKMRAAVARSLRQLRRLARHHAEGRAPINRLTRQQTALILRSSASRSLCPVRHNDEYGRFVSPAVESLRNMFSTATADSIKGFNFVTFLCMEPFIFSAGGIWISLITSSDVPRGGPMVEYEKRIASGDLVDGDSFQVIELDLINVFLAWFPWVFYWRFFWTFTNWRRLTRFSNYKGFMRIL